MGLCLGMVRMRVPSDGIEMVDSRDLRHGLAADLDFPHLGAFGEIVDGG